MISYVDVHNINIGFYVLFIFQKRFICVSKAIGEHTTPKHFKYFKDIFASDISEMQTEWNFDWTYLEDEQEREKYLAQFDFIQISPNQDELIKISQTMYPEYFI